MSAETSTSPRGLRAILNALVGLELLAKDDQERYALTAESAMFLVSGKPTFHGAFFLLTSEPMLSQWRKLHEIVGSGRPAQHINREQDGVDFFSRFVEAIFPIHYPAARRLAEALGVAKATAPVSVLDLAAGSGVWSVALAQQSPLVRVTAVDWAGVIPITRKVTARLGLADRFRFVEGDLHETDFGRGHAIASLGHILHSEGEPRSRLLLDKTFDALAPGGTIAIAEILVDETRTGPLPGLLFAVNLLAGRDQHVAGQHRLRGCPNGGGPRTGPSVDPGDEAERLGRDPLGSGGPVRRDMLPRMQYAARRLTSRRGIMPELFETIQTMRAMRRLKPDPVPDELIGKILQAGVCAPNGANLQTWRFLVVKDPAIKQQVQVYYKRAFDEVMGPHYRTAAPPPGVTKEAYLRQMAAVEYLTDHFHEAPVWIVACLDHGTGLPNRGSGASIYPAVQNMLLTARALGLGATLTTRHLMYEKETEAALGLPPGVHSYAILPIGYPVGNFGPVRRGRPLGEIVFQDRWNNRYAGV